jgi:hypothetical protein
VTRRRLTRVELAELLELQESFLVELEDSELLVPDAAGTYDVIAVQRARVCWSMHHGLGVNLAGLEVILGMLERWEDERRRMRALIAQLREELERE